MVPKAKAALKMSRDYLGRVKAIKIAYYDVSTKKKNNQKISSIAPGVITE